MTVKHMQSLKLVILIILLHAVFLYMCTLSHIVV